MAPVEFAAVQLGLVNVFTCVVDIEFAGWSNKALVLYYFLQLAGLVVDDHDR
jgi:hypothetical protein